jgi:hypothetical protein
MADPLTAVASSLCNPPSLSLVAPSFDILALIVAALQSLGISLPKMPTIPIPKPPCGLD